MSKKSSGSVGFSIFEERLTSVTPAVIAVQAIAESSREPLSPFKANVTTEAFQGKKRKLRFSMGGAVKATRQESKLPDNVSKKGENIEAMIASLMMDGSSRKVEAMDLGGLTLSERFTTEELVPSFWWSSSLCDNKVVQQGSLSFPQEDEVLLEQLLDTVLPIDKQDPLHADPEGQEEYFSNSHVSF